MKVRIHDTPEHLAHAVADRSVEILRRAVEERGEAAALFATGVSQEGILRRLCNADLPWERIVGFHLDEYVDLPADHPASFRCFLTERLVEHVPFRDFHFIRPGQSPDSAVEECRRLADLLAEHPVDLAFAGIGENGHLAFNEPPADFDTDLDFQVLELEERSRRQLWRQGWFHAEAEVPTCAVTITIPAILRSRHILCAAFGERKRDIVARVVDGPVTPDVPASVLQDHDGAVFHLDAVAAGGIAPPAP